MNWKGFAFIVFSTVFLVQLVRSLPWPPHAKRKKPLACSVCMVSWVSLVVCIPIYQLNFPFLERLYEHGFCAGAALVLLTTLEWLQGPVSVPDESTH